MQPLTMRRAMMVGIKDYFVTDLLKVFGVNWDKHVVDKINRKIISLWICVHRTNNVN